MTQKFKTSPWRPANFTANLFHVLFPLLFLFKLPFFPEDFLINKCQNRKTPARKKANKF